MIECDLLTVIIPVKNGESYIGRCIDSIINQSLKGINIIVVDDGSTDETIQIVRNYTLLDDRIKIICHAQNRGTGVARNTGLALAKSKYVAFLDADDWMDTNSYNLMINSLEKTGAEIAICGVRNEHETLNSSSIRYSYPFENLIASNFSLQLLTRSRSQDAYITPMVGNKVFLRKHLSDNQIFFPPRSLFEDDEFMFLAIWAAKRIILVPNCFQHYYQHSESAMHSFSFSNIDCLLQTFQEIREYIEKKGQFAAIEDEYYAFFDRCVSSLLGVLFSCVQNTTEQRKYMTYFMEQTLQVFSVKDLVDHIDPIRFQYFWG